MKVGDLVRVFEPRACGGVPEDAIGVVIESKMARHHDPNRHNQWVVMWLTGNELHGGLHVINESVTYGHGIEVISEK